MNILRPSQPSFYDAIDGAILPSVRTMLCVHCFRCWRTEDLSSVSLPTYDVNELIITCSKNECKALLKASILHALRKSNMLFCLPTWIREDFTTPRVSVRRTSGIIEDDWTVLGFFFNDEGAHKVAVVKSNLSLMKYMYLPEFFTLNPDAVEACQAIVDVIVQLVFDEMRVVVEPQLASKAEDTIV